jgi:hypothetical protein
MEPDMTLTVGQRAIGGIALLALCSCATAPPPLPKPPPEPVAPVSLLPQTPPPPPPPAKPPPPRKRDEPRPAIAAPAQAPVQLVGLDENQLHQLLGAPASVENHSPGKTLRFRRQDCVLSLALYPDVESRVFRTLSYEVTSDDNSSGTAQQCRAKFGAVAVSQ